MDPSSIRKAHLARLKRKADNRASYHAQTSGLYKPVARGEAHRSATLTADQVRKGRALAKEGMPVPEIARKLKVGYEAIRKAIRGHSWRHVD